MSYAVLEALLIDWIQFTLTVLYTTIWWISNSNWIFFLFLCLFADWSNANDHERVQRQLSVSSDSKLLDDDIREETRVIMRPKKPPRPKSEVFLNKPDLHPRRKRFSAFGVSFPIFNSLFSLHEDNFDGKFWKESLIFSRCLEWREPAKLGMKKCFSYPVQTLLIK